MSSATRFIIRKRRIFMRKHLLIMLAMVAVMVLATTACGSDTVITPQDNEPITETTTPETTPTPDVPE